MKFVALISGGKDSVYSACKLIEDGHELIGILYMKCNLSYIDSYMYQTVGSEFIESIAKSFGKPLYVFETNCNPINQDLEYNPTIGDEVEELYMGLKQLKEKCNFEAISSGAIFSSYQKNRVENICKRLNITSLAPLWQRNQKELLKEMIEYGIDARIVKIACPNYTINCLGMNLKQLYDYMEEHKHPYGYNYCGEGGEFESIVVDCPYFIKKIKLGDYEISKHPEEINKEGNVFYCTYSNINLESK